MIFEVADNGNLRIELLGGFSALRNGQPVTRGFTGRLQSLLAYLTLHPRATISRQHLAFLFWGDSGESQARTNLRQLLHNLRAALPETQRYLKGDHQGLCWQPDEGCTTDVLEFETAISQGDLDIAADLYRGDLLPGLYDEWLEPERERLSRLYESTLERLIAAAEDRRDFADAIRFAERRLARDELREASYQNLMRLQARIGDRAAALRTYERCAEILRRELGVEPGPATRRARDHAMELQPTPEIETPAPAVRRAGRKNPLIGRDAEWKTLKEIWRAAEKGQPNMVVLSGEAGIGKTRLLEELLDLALIGGASIACASCYAGDRALAFNAAADWLRSPAIRPHLSELPALQRSQLTRLVPEVLLDQAEMPLLPPFTDAWQKRLFFEALARAVLSPGTPVLLSIDDLQWCDPETVEWLHYLIRFDPSARLLIAMTARTGQTASANLVIWERLVKIELEPLTQEATAQLAAQTAGHEVDRARLDSLYEKTRGNPLFVVETVRAGWSGSGEIPAKLHAVITGRLEQLSADAQRVAGIAAVIGRPFTAELILALAGLDEDSAIRAIDELWKHRILQSDEKGAYDFSHAYLRDVMYTRVGPARKQQLHRRVAEALATSDASEMDVLCGQLGSHYERAGMPQHAIPYYQRAAYVAQRRFSEAEAITILSKALELLKALPGSTDRDHLELELLVALGRSIRATQGYASEESGKIYSRARMLCEVSGDVDLSFRVLAGSWLFHAVRAELVISHEIAQRYLALARQNGDPMLLAAGHFCLGTSTCHLGFVRDAYELLLASRRFEHESERSGRFLDFGPELGIFREAYMTHLLWLLDDAEQALHQCTQVLARAQSLSHPFSLALALAYSAMLHHFCDEPEAAQERAEAAAAICRRYNFRYYLAWTPIILGWGQARSGDRQGGLARMLQGFDELRETGAKLRAPYYLSLIAQTYGECGNQAEGLRRLEEAAQLGEASEEKWLQPELQRIRGNLLSSTGDRMGAETCYRNALRLAKQAGSRAWELRAEKSLAALAN